MDRDGLLLLVSNDGAQFDVPAGAAQCELRAMLASTTDSSVRALLSSEGLSPAIAIATNAPCSSTADLAKFLSTGSLPTSEAALLSLYRLSALLRVASCRDSIEAALVSTNADSNNWHHAEAAGRGASSDVGAISTRVKTDDAVGRDQATTLGEPVAGLTSAEYVSGAWRALYKRREETDTEARLHTSEAAAAPEPRSSFEHMCAAAKLTALPDPFRLYRHDFLP